MKKLILNKIKYIFYLSVLVVFIANIPMAHAKADIEADYPIGDIKVLNNPYPGVIFVGNVETPAAIYDNYGRVTTPEKFTHLKKGTDFKMHKNGKITYFDHSIWAFVVLDKNLNYLDTFAIPQEDEYDQLKRTDVHDINFRDNGNVLMFSFYPRTMDLSEKVIGGRTDALVWGNDLYEFDQNHNVVWRWSSFDHIDITETVDNIDLTERTIDYVHFNTAMYDTDGNIIVSARHLDELIKINRQNGSIMWRMGGSHSKKNDFSFLNDSDEFGNTGFSAQHAPIRLTNGNLMLFDNGNHKDGTKYSRAVEYEVDEANKSVKKVWQFRRNPDLYVAFMGSVQELPNGNIFMNFWREQIEVTKAGQVALHIVFDKEDPTYRAYKYPYNLDFKILHVSQLGLLNFNDAQYNTNLQMQVTALSGSGEVTAIRYPYTTHDSAFHDTSFVQKTLPVRYVLQKPRGITKISFKLIIDTKNIVGFNPADSMYIFYRTKETSGSFVKIPTHYDPVNKTLSGNLNDVGEIILAKTANIDKGITSEPKGGSVGLPLSVTLKWEKLVGVNSYRIKLSSNPSLTKIVVDTTVKTNKLTLKGLTYFTQYYWSVRGFNNVEIGDWSDTVSFRTVVDKPVLQNPENNAYYVNNYGTLTWSQVTGANQYRIQISKDSYFNDNLVDSLITNRSEYDYKNLETNSTFYWRVMSLREENGFTENSVFSDFLKFTTKLDKPNLRFPANKSHFIPTDFKFVWYNVAGSVRYFFEICTDTLNSKTVVVSDTTIITNSVDVTNLKNFQTYYWRIKAVNLQNYSQWSNYFTFETKIAEPLLAQPTNGSSSLDNEVKLSWEKTEGAGFRKLQVFKAEDSLSISDDNKILDEMVVGDSYTIQKLDFDSRYFWRIKTMSDYGETNWSDYWSFRTRVANILSSPSLILPKNEEVLVESKVELRWYLQNSQNYNYRVQISEDKNFNELLLDTLITKDNLLLDLQEKETTYYWRVQTVSANLNSEWSVVRLFIVNRESLNWPIAILISPENNQLVKKESLSFTWDISIENEGLNLDGFVFQIAKDNTFDNIIFTQNTGTETQFTLSEELVTLLQENTTYYWKVQAIINGKVANWSQVYSFTIDKTISSIHGSNSFNAGVKILPNPSSEFLEITFDSDNKNIIGNITDFTIVNMAGSKIVTQVINETNIKINLHQWNSGLYLLILYNRAGEVVSTSFFQVVK